MPRTSGYKNRGLNNPNSYRNRDKSSATSNKGAETINTNSTTKQNTTSTPTATSLKFGGDSRDYGGKYFRYPVEVDGKGNTGDTFLIKCVEYIVPSKGKDIKNPDGSIKKKGIDNRIGIGIDDIVDKNDKVIGRKPTVRNFGMTVMQEPVNNKKQNIL